MELWQMSEESKPKIAGSIPANTEQFLPSLSPRSGHDDKSDANNYPDYQTLYPVSYSISSLLLYTLSHFLSNPMYIISKVPYSLSCLLYNSSCKSHTRFFYCAFNPLLTYAHWIVNYFWAHLFSVIIQVIKGQQKLSTWFFIMKHARYFNDYEVSPGYCNDFILMVLLLTEAVWT